MAVRRENLTKKREPKRAVVEQDVKRQRHYYLEEGRNKKDIVSIRQGKGRSAEYWGLLRGKGQILIQKLILKWEMSDTGSLYLDSTVSKQKPQVRRSSRK